MGALLASVRDRLDEPNAKYWTNAQIEKWINEGARDVCRRAECLQAKGTVSITGGTQEYNMPTDVVRVYRAEFVRTGDSQVYTLLYRDLNLMDEIWVTQKTLQQSTPSYFYMWGFPSATAGNFKIGLYPTPSVNGTLTIFYYRLPAEIATDGSGDSTAIDMPEGWEDLTVDYAEYYALRKDNDPRWQDAKGIYETKVTDMVATANRWTDQEGMIVSDSGTGYVPYWLYSGGYY